MSGLGTHTKGEAQEKTGQQQEPLQPDVSVIIAAWNAEPFIHHAMASVLDQAGLSLELIVIDDCSTDETEAAARKAASDDKRVTISRMPENGGPSAARNYGLSMAKGRYAAVLDSDDSFVKDRLAKLVSAADETEADIIVDNIVRVDASGHSIDNEPFLTDAKYQQRHEIDLTGYVNGNIFMSGGSALGYLKPMFRLETVRRMELAYDTLLRNSEDYYLVADIIAQGGRMIYEPLEGYLYRVDAGSISHRLRPELTAALVDAEEKFQKRYAGKLCRREAKALSQRLNRLKNADVYIRLLESIKARNIPASVAVLLGRPTAIGFCAQQLRQIARKKLSA